LYDNNDDYDEAIQEENNDGGENENDE